MPTIPALLAAFRRLSPESVDVPDAADTDVAYQDVKRRMAALKPALKPAHLSQPRVRRQRWVPYLAAGVGLVLVAGLVMGPKAASEYETHQSGAGERTRIQLADGSSVLLAPESRIRYTRDFGSRTRDIHLEGEALFTVSHHTGQPFVVHTGDAQTRVLGTAFTVRHDTSTGITRVVVAEGKVMLQDVPLTSGDAGILVAGRPVTVEHDSNLNAELAWTAGRLMFEQTPLREMIPQLRRWYGISVDVSDRTMLDERMTTVFETNDADAMVVKLAALLNAQATMSGSTLTLVRNLPSEK